MGPPLIPLGHLDETTVVERRWEQAAEGGGRITLVTLAGITHVVIPAGRECIQ